MWTGLRSHGRAPRSRASLFLCRVGRGLLPSPSPGQLGPSWCWPHTPMPGQHLPSSQLQLVGSGPGGRYEGGRSLHTGIPAEGGDPPGVQPLYQPWGAPVLPFSTQLCSWGGSWGLGLALSLLVSTFPVAQHSGMGVGTGVLCRWLVSGVRCPLEVECLAPPLGPVLGMSAVLASCVPSTGSPRGTPG